MKGFKLITQHHQSIRFEYYLEAAPVTTKSFAALLPFTRTFVHTRISGQEIWKIGEQVLTFGTLDNTGFGVMYGKQIFLSLLMKNGTEHKASCGNQILA